METITKENAAEAVERVDARRRVRTCSDPTCEVHGEEVTGRNIEADGTLTLRQTCPGCGSPLVRLAAGTRQRDEQRVRADDVTLCAAELRVAARSVATSVQAPITCWALRRTADNPALSPAILARVVRQHYDGDLRWWRSPLSGPVLQRYRVEELGKALKSLEDALDAQAVTDRAAEVAACG